MEKNKFIVKIPKFYDERGFFQKVFQSKNFNSHIKKVNQINLSFSKKKGTVRGMHYQKGKHKEEKILTCLKGKIFLVIVNINKDSDIYLKKKYFEIDDKEFKFIKIPKDYSVGFQTLTKNSLILYLHTKNYSDKHQGQINPKDPKLNIKWPNKITSISNRDKLYKFIQ